MSAHHNKVCFSKARYIIYQPYPGLHLAYHAKRFYVSERSKYQKIDIIENEAYGRMLFLDNNVQHTEYDAHVFSEALCGEAKRKNAAHILVLGGGSGQTAKALLESPSVEQVTIVEIDSQVVDCCRRYVKGINRVFSDDRVRILIGNAFDYIHSTADKFDAAVIDLTEAPFAIGSLSRTLKRLYADIEEKCEGCCSQYIGSEVDLAYGRRFRDLLDRMSRKYLSNIRYVSTFIPSFGAPHVIMHAGYKQPSKSSI
jgi:spermidine synthase